MASRRTAAKETHQQVLTVVLSTPLDIPTTVFLTVVIVSNEAREPINTENMTRPRRNQIIANTLPKIDLGQRSPYLQLNAK